jgi:hypothetical protein
MPIESEQLISVCGTDNGSASPTLVFNGFHRIPDCSSNSLVESVSRSTFRVAQNPEVIEPFSTPGPASTIFRISTSPCLTFDNLDIRFLQTPFEHAGSSDRGSLEGLCEVGVEDWQCLAPETDFIVSPLPTTVKVDKFEDFYPSPDPAGAVPFTKEVASFELQDHSKPSVSHYPELTDLDFRWNAFDRKGIFPHNVGPDETRTKLRSNHFASGTERPFFDRSPSPDNHCFHFQTILNATNKANEAERPLENFVSTQELSLTETNSIGLKIGYESGMEYCQRQHSGDIMRPYSDE